MDTYKAPSTHIDREFLKTESFFSSLGYVHSASDSFCAVMKIIPDRASVHTQERLWWRDFCNGAKLRPADLESGGSHIG